MWLGLLVADWFAPLIRNVLACCHCHQTDQDDRWQNLDLILIALEPSKRPEVHSIDVLSLRDGCSIFELATPLAPGAFLLLASLGNLTKASQTWCFCIPLPCSWCVCPKLQLFGIILTGCTICTKTKVDRFWTHKGLLVCTPSHSRSEIFTGVMESKLCITH
jgi:hypothetical protein